MIHPFFKRYVCPCLLYLFFTFHSLSAQKVEITLFHGFIDPGIQLSLEKLIYEFNISYPEVKIKPVYYGLEDDLLQRLPMWIASNKLPDILIWSPPFLASLNKDIPLQDLTPLWKKLALERRVKQKIARSHQINGTYFAIPFTTNALGLIINKKLFSEYKIRPPKTWQEWLDVIKKFHNRGITPIYISDIEAEWSVWFWEILYWQLGGRFHNDSSSIFRLDSIAFMRSAQFYRLLYQSSLEITHSLQLTIRNYFPSFLEGKVPMIIMGNWVYTEFKKRKILEQLEVLPIPSPSGNQIQSNIGGESMAVLTSDSLKLYYIYEFFKFLIEKRKLIGFNMSIGTFSPVDLQVQTRFIRQDHFLNSFYKIYLHGNVRPDLLYYDKFSKLMGFYLKQYLHGKIQLKEFYDKLLKDVNQEIQNIQKKR
jgi:ABC-type glycerol-3-phosphate transport system substrate-binding protein